MAHQETGNTLEWKIAKTEVSAPFTFWATTYDAGSSPATYDIVPNLEGSGITVPEPASAAMLCIGALMLLAGGRRRRKN